MNHAERRTRPNRRSKRRRNERVFEVPSSRTSLSENTAELISFWQGQLYGEQDTAPLTRIHRPPRLITHSETAVRRHPVRPHGTRSHDDDSETLSDSRSSESASEDSPLGISGSPIIVLAMATVLFGFLIAAIALILARTDQDSEMQPPYKMHAPHIVVHRSSRKQAAQRTLAPTRLVRARMSQVPVAKNERNNSPAATTPTKASTARSTSTSRKPGARTMVKRLDYSPVGSPTSDRSISKPQPQAQSICSVVLHSYCARIREEFFYLPSANSCVTALGDSTVLCNHSPNRFASLSSCTQRCVYPSKPSERCFHTAMFSQCVSRDVKSSLWFFDGTDCRQWHFPLGACPSTYEGGHVFPNLRACLRQCTGRGLPVSSCQMPAAGPCEPLRLRYPYFAAFTPSSGGRLRCFEASAAVLRHHRCPTGSNRFLTPESCRKACHRSDASPDTYSLSVPSGPSVEQEKDNQYFPPFEPLADADDVDGVDSVNAATSTGHEFRLKQ